MTIAIFVMQLLAWLGGIVCAISAMSSYEVERPAWLCASVLFYIFAMLLREAGLK
jgi:hypothetical protein